MISGIITTANSLEFRADIPESKLGPDFQVVVKIIDNGFYAAIEHKNPMALLKLKMGFDEGNLVRYETITNTLDKLNVSLKLDSGFLLNLASLTNRLISRESCKEWLKFFSSNCERYKDVFWWDLHFNPYEASPKVSVSSNFLNKKVLIFNKGWSIVYGSELVPDYLFYGKIKEFLCEKLDVLIYANNSIPEDLYRFFAKKR